MAKPRIRYGVLDDFGEVVRWSWSKPSGSYRYIIERVRQPFVPDEPAPF